jgi:hypothetical protein
MASAGGSRNDIYDSVGYSGLPRFAGFVFDEFLLELQGPRGRRAFREMADNDSTVGALLFAITMLCRRVEWSIRPDEAAPEDDRPELIDQSLNDMVVPWRDRLSEILSFLPYGWALHEQVYKIRDGTNSKYSDGRIGWYDWALRGQETLLKWEFDDAGGILGMWQLGPPDYRQVFIPMTKALLFRTTVVRGNPEGRSILRNAYRAWYFKKNVEIFEGIGIERDLAGLPYLRIPGQILEAANNPNATPQDQLALTAYQEMVRQVRVNEGHGIILPSDVDPETKTPMYEFQLLKTGGQKQFDTNEIINRLKLDITQTVLADFLQVGHESQGSHALAEAKTDLFAAALQAVLETVTSAVNDVAIPRLLKLNGMSTEFAPRLVHGDINQVDLDSLGGYLSKLASAGFQLDTTWDGNLLKDVLQKAGLPEPPETMPATLNEPVTVYEQTTDQVPQPMPNPGKKRMPARPGQPAQTPNSPAPATQSQPTKD